VRGPKIRDENNLVSKFSRAERALRKDEEKKLTKKILEYLGVEPSASRMLSERSTDELEPHLVGKLCHLPQLLAFASRSTDATMRVTSFLQLEPDKKKSQARLRTDTFRQKDKVLLLRFHMMVSSDRKQKNADSDRRIYNPSFATLTAEHYKYTGQTV
jgi:hypothetical protein